MRACAPSFSPSTRCFPFASQRHHLCDFVLLVVASITILKRHVIPQLAPVREALVHHARKQPGVEHLGDGRSQGELESRPRALCGFSSCFVGFLDCRRACAFATGVSEVIGFGVKKSNIDNKLLTYE